MVYLDKLGLLSDQGTGEAAEWGLRLEGPIAAKFEEDTLRQRPPPADGSEATTKAIREAFAESDPEQAVELPESALPLIAERRRAAAAEKAAKELREQAQNALALVLGSAERGT